MNKAILVGKIHRAPEFKQINDDFCILNFSVNTFESYKDKASNERKYIHEWTEVQLTNGQALALKEMLTIKSLVLVEGKVKTRSWLDKDSNAKRFKTFIDAKLVKILEYGEPKEVSNEPIDDIPF